MTLVLNLSTGKERYYTLPPLLALRNVTLQESGNANTWDYGTLTAPIKSSVSGRTASAGDWCVRCDLSEANA